MMLPAMMLKENAAGRANVNVLHGVEGAGAHLLPADMS